MTVDLTAAPSVLTDRSGDHVVQIGYTDGRVIATGRRFRLREVHLWQLENGLITGWAVHLDARAMLAALR